MSFKKVSKTLVIGAFVLTLSAVAFGQAVVQGTVLKNSGDSNFAPVAGVKVVCFRTDVKEKCGEVTTAADGKFKFEGLPTTATVGLGLSGPELAPTYYPEFAVTEPRAKKLYVQVNDGDGKEGPEDQLRKEIVGEGMSAEDKKKRNDQELENQRLFESLFDVKLRNAMREKLIKEGNEAYNSADYRTAMAKFKQGYELDPEFLGSAPVFLNNQATSTQKLVIQNYNEAVKSKDKNRINVTRSALANGLKDSVSLGMKVVKMVNADNSLDSKYARSNKANLEDAKRIIVDAFRILGQLKITFPVESEEQGKEGIELHMNVLEVMPDEPGVLGSLMLSLYNMGFWGDETFFQKSLNYGDYFLKKAPKDHPRRAAVAEIVKVLKTENKLKPQPIN